MKITNRTVVQSTASLNELTELKLPVKTAFQLAKIARKLSDILDSYNEILKKLQQEHVQRDEEGVEISVPDETRPQVRHLQFKEPEIFYAAHDELLEIENEVNFSPLSIDSLGDVELSATTLYQLDWLFTG